jgi:hypothetical protein
MSAVAGTNVTLERVSVQPAGNRQDVLEVALRAVPVKAAYVPMSTVTLVKGD